MLSGPSRSSSRMSCTTRSALLKVVPGCFALLLTVAGGIPQVLARSAAAASWQDPPAAAPDQEDTEQRTAETGAGNRAAAVRKKMAGSS